MVVPRGVGEGRISVRSKRTYSCTQYSHITSCASVLIAYILFETKHWVTRVSCIERGEEGGPGIPKESFPKIHHMRKALNTN